MRMLSTEKKIEVLKLILEGCSIRTTERLTGVQRDTIARLIVSTGENCHDLHDAFFRNLSSINIEFDELWSYVGIKQKNLPSFSIVRHRGDQYLFIAFDRDRKAVISYRVGKRDSAEAREFLKDVRARVTGRCHLNSDKFIPYEKIVGEVFGEGCHYGQVVKNYNSKGQIKSVMTRLVQGRPEVISTTAVERYNLTLRMGIRRLARKTNAFSKKMPNHKAAIALFIGYYNFCRLHARTKRTPAMALGITMHAWSIEDLFDLKVIKETVAASA